MISSKSNSHMACFLQHFQRMIELEILFLSKLLRLHHPHWHGDIKSWTMISTSTFSSLGEWSSHMPLPIDVQRLRFITSRWLIAPLPKGIELIWKSLWRQRRPLEQGAIMCGLALIATALMILPSACTAGAKMAMKVPVQWSRSSQSVNSRMEEPIAELPMEENVWCLIKGKLSPF